MRTPNVIDAAEAVCSYIKQAVEIRTFEFDTLRNIAREGNEAEVLYEIDDVLFGEVLTFEDAEERRAHRNLYGDAWLELLNPLAAGLIASVRRELELADA